MIRINQNSLTCPGKQMEGEIKLSAVPLGALSHLLFGENSQSEGRAFTGGISDDGIRDN